MHKNKTCKQKQKIKLVEKGCEDNNNQCGLAKIKLPILVPTKH